LIPSLPGELKLEAPEGVLLFTGYGEDWVALAGERIQTGFLLHEGRLQAPWGPDSIERITEKMLAPIFDAPPEVLLIGSGRKTRFPPSSLIAALQRKGIGWESMDTRAAARTYNLLAIEGRRVSLAAIPPQQ